MLKSGYPNAILAALLVLSLASCSKNSYQGVLKSTDLDFKLQKAKEYYNAGIYHQAIPLLEEQMTLRKGELSTEKLLYFYAYCHYGQEDYQLASFYFKNFLDNYPKSMYAEDAQFMTAYSYYKLSPEPSLEQTSTTKALELFQVFANTYPNSDRIERTNNLMDQLRKKLEVKAYNSAQLYFKMGSYEAAATSFKNLLSDFPDTRQHREIMFMVLKSYQLFAQNSIAEKKEDRYGEAIDAYFAYIDRYPDADNLREAEKIYEACMDDLEHSRTKR